MNTCTNTAKTVSILQKISQKNALSASAPFPKRSFASGTRGARGHGWYHKFKEGKGGRHLQGRYFNRDIDKRVAINNEVFAMTNGNSEEVKKQVAYLDFKIGQQEDEGDAVSGAGAGAEKEGKSNRNSGGLKRVTIELATEALPLTCQNFMALCEEKDTNESEISYSYQNSKVFKIEPKVGICLGDIISSTGLSGSCHPSTSVSASASATTATKTNTSPNTFPHESTVLSHAEKGMVSMLHSGRDRNDSRFVITTKNAPHLDGKYVAFGRVKEGLDFLEDIVKNVYTRKGRPTVDIEVVKCGIL